jgi:hypothetical protein
VAPLIDPTAGRCRDHFGNVISRFDRSGLTVDHVNERATRGRRAPSDPEHMVMLCAGHHLLTSAGANWATSHRPELRTYLKGFTVTI